MNKSDFLPYLKNIVTELENNNVTYEIPFCYINKNDFNHINIIVSNEVSAKELAFYFTDFKFEKESNNIIFSKIENFPVNFIRTENENIKYAFYHYNWNVLNVFIQCLTSKFELKYTNTGLYGLHNILISRNLMDICDFLGLNFKMYNVGFLNEFLIYAYITNSHFYSSKYFTISNFKQFDPFYEFNKTYYDNFITHMKSYKDNVDDISDTVEFVDGMFPDSGYMKKFYDIELKNEINR